jgi:hypothetical protein
LDKFSEGELQKNVDQGLDDLLNPIKEKEKLVDQLQTQIVDLERFVSFLQQESNTIQEEEDGSEKTAAPRSIESAYKQPLQRKKSIFNLIGGSRYFERNELKKTPAGNHYG